MRGHVVFSAANRRRLAVVTWSPDHGGDELPVVVLLHGVGDLGVGWWNDARAPQQAEQLVASGELPPFHLVIPNDTGIEVTSGYCDWVDGSARAETWIVEELVAWVRQELSPHGSLHLGGLSMGGYGAFLLALRNPGIFESASSTSGAFDPFRMPLYVPGATQRMWSGTAGRDAHDVAVLVADPARWRGLRMAFDCGTDDELVDLNRGLHARMSEIEVPHVYVERPGGHTWPYWTGRLPHHLRFHLGRGGDLVV
ncbi:MAG: alpha/beta hydrolase [Candidatus Dormibacteria bacterium]